MWGETRGGRGLQILECPLHTHETVNEEIQKKLQKRMLCLFVTNDMCFRGHAHLLTGKK